MVRGSRGGAGVPVMPDGSPGLKSHAKAESAARAGQIVRAITRFRENLSELASVLDPRTIVSSIIRDAIWRVWRWDFLAEVRVQEGEPLENALRRFKRKVQQEDIIKEVKRHSYYLKPGEKKRVKAALARKRNRKKARKEQD
jgi:small subunit ribosomal protein S21